MSEAVEILIQADDTATGKLKTVGDAIDSQVKRIKTVGGQAKASTEFIGSLANALGGSELGGYASQLAQLTERMSAFSEVSKVGGAGAMAFKAGLVGAVAVGAFTAGKAIGDAVFETEKWKQALVDATKEAERLNAEIAKGNERRFAERQEDISLIGDPAERRKAQEQQLETLKREIAGNEKLLEESKNAAKLAAASKTESIAKGLRASGDSQSFALGMLLSKFGGGKDAQLEKQVEEERQKLKDLKEKERVLESQLKGREADNEKTRQQNQAKERSDAFIAGLREELALTKATREERFALEAAKLANSPEAQAEAARLLKEIDRIKEKAEAQKKADAEAEQARAKTKADSERLEDMRKGELQRIKERTIAITQGQEAARAFALESKGIDAATAKNIAARESILDQMQAIGKEPQLQAKEGRLLTRGDGPGDAQRATAANTKEILAAQLRALEAQQRQLDAQNETNRQLREGGTTRIVMVP